MPDVEWIEYCGRNGVVALTANPEIWKVPHEIACVREYGARLIAMKATMSRLESAMVVGQNIRLIKSVIKTPGPAFIQITSGPPTRRRLE
ncbi:hypothetical protein GCM10027289_27670 [Tsukamurella serpentis]